MKSVIEINKHLKTITINGENESTTRKNIYSELDMDTVFNLSFLNITWL